MVARLNRLSTSLLFGSAIPLVLFTAVAVVAWISIDRLLGALALEKRSNEAIVRALKQQQKLQQMRLTIYWASLQLPVQAQQTYQANRGDFHRLATELAELVEDSPQQQPRVARIQRLEKKWEEMIESYLAALKAKPGQDGDRGLRQLLGPAEKLMEQLEAETTLLVDAEGAVLAERREQAATQSRQSVLLIAGAFGLALVLTIALAFQSARSLTRPIRQLREAASQLMAGRVVLVPPSGPTEIAELIGHFNHMAVTLSRQSSALQAQEQRYRTYIGAVSHILWTANASGEVVGDLPAWRAFTGQGEEAIQGMGWLDAVHADDREAVERAWRSAVAERTIFEIDCRLRSSQGCFRHFSCRGVPILTSDGSVQEWIGTCTDITERKQEAALREAKEAAEAQSQAKTEFLAKMSHELRTPLNAVIGMSNMLLTRRFGALTAKQADYLKDITQAGEHLLALINDILDLARVEAGRLDVQAGSFPLTQAITGVVSTLLPLAEAKALCIRVNHAGGEGALTTDPGRVRQILYNLLSNAIKFTAAGGKITLRSAWLQRPDQGAAVVPEAEATAVRVEVQDTGIGISADDQASIWDEFWQVRNSRQDGQPGAGLGLALTRHLVELLGGQIWLESAPGQGSTFSFVLPRQLPPKPEMATEEIVAETASA
jgi:PAS domain S-box-containing protein